MEITDIITAAVSEAQLLALAASVAESAGHPLREVLKNAAAGLNLPACSGVVMLRGGIAAQCSRKKYPHGHGGVCAYCGGCSCRFCQI